MCMLNIPNPKMEVYYLFFICKFTHTLKWVHNLAPHTFLLRVEQMPFVVELTGSILSIGYAPIFFFFLIWICMKRQDIVL